MYETTKQVSPSQLRSWSSWESEAMLWWWEGEEAMAPAALKAPPARCGRKHPPSCSAPPAPLTPTFTHFSLPRSPRVLLQSSNTPS